ncbi:TIGR02444 family protein [Mycolicibacterium sp.]|uniref:TIGR02444 family protein n=1 Tax=Mycolicibacterium sp. TaxID=2320850 RepID=UPI001A1CF8D9|nr:TIGR02444 family protein [Mycolicibacterium sp.]MBJ7339013.1 TIGR02444 family protein [Mycolicibacterium sp.]
MTDSRDDLRSFALNVHGCDGVASACVLLQDRCGVDVNVLLLAAYVGAVKGASVTPADVAAVSARTMPWQRDVIGPLRAVRTGLKVGPPPAPNDATAALRDAVKAVELEAELIELNELAALVACLDAPAAPGSARDRAAAAMLVVTGACRGLGAGERAAIDTIASAAARFGKE